MAKKTRNPKRRDAELAQNLPDVLPANKRMFDAVERWKRRALGLVHGASDPPPYEIAQDQWALELGNEREDLPRLNLRAILGQDRYGELKRGERMLESGNRTEFEQGVQICVDAADEVQEWLRSHEIAEVAGGEGEPEAGGAATGPGNWKTRGGPRGLLQSSLLAKWTVPPLGLEGLSDREKAAALAERYPDDPPEKRERLNELDWCEYQIDHATSPAAASAAVSARRLLEYSGLADIRSLVGLAGYDGLLEAGTALRKARTPEELDDARDRFRSRIQEARDRLRAQARKDGRPEKARSAAKKPARLAEQERIALKLDRLKEKLEEQFHEEQGKFLAEHKADLDALPTALAFNMRVLGPHMVRLARGVAEAFEEVGVWDEARMLGLCRFELSRFANWYEGEGKAEGQDQGTEANVEKVRRNLKRCEEDALVKARLLLKEKRLDVKAPEAGAGAAGGEGGGSWREALEHVTRGQKQDASQEARLKWPRAPDKLLGPLILTDRLRRLVEAYEEHCDTLRGADLPAPPVGIMKIVRTLEKGSGLGVPDFEPVKLHEVVAPLTTDGALRLRTMAEAEPALLSKHQHERQEGVRYFKRVVELMEAHLQGLVDGSASDEGRAEVRKEKDWPDPQKHTVAKVWTTKGGVLHFKTKTDGREDGEALFQKGDKQTALMHLLVYTGDAGATASEALHAVYDEEVGGCRDETNGLQRLFARLRSLVSDIRKKLEKRGINPNVLTGIGPVASLSEKTRIALRLAKTHELDEKRRPLDKSDLPPPDSEST